MKLPSMKFGDGITKGRQIKFAGMNHSEGAGDGELWDMRNMTSDHYPLLASRAKRIKYRSFTSPGGLFSWEGLCWVDGTCFYFKGEEKGQVSEGLKTFASMGAYILIFPDKCYYNVDTDEFGSLEATWSGTELTFCDGLLYGEKATANCITCPGTKWADYFRSGDAVSIAGCTINTDNNRSIIIRAIDGDKLYFYEHSFTLGDDGAAYSETGELTIKRTVPDLKYVCENENRLWGCTDTTIHASKLGDVFNWNVADGLESDSYELTPGTAGVFTGCISYRGYPTFFKEDDICKVYGSVPSNFEVLGNATLGLAAGCNGSLAIAGETLFYLSRSGVMAYTGGIPQPMNRDFGLLRFKNAVGGSDGLKYYVSMEESSGAWGLYVYDTQKGLWHKEDESHVTHFARWAGNLYMLTQEGDLWIIGNAQDPPTDATEEDTLEWFVEFADFTDEDPNKKGVSKIQIRLELEDSATVQVWLMFDSDGQWHKVSTVIGEGIKRSYYLPITPRRSDHYRLKLTGTGTCRIFSLVREYYIGSELKSKTGRN